MEIREISNGKESIVMPLSWKSFQVFANENGDKYYWEQLTSFAPLQYDIYYNQKQVAYFRCRHDLLELYMPDSQSEQPIFSKEYNENCGFNAEPYTLEEVKEFLELLKEITLILNKNLEHN